MTLMRLKAAEEQKGAYGNFNFIVVFHFYQRRIAFAFSEHHVAQRFLACFELLVRNVKQSKGGGPQMVHSYSAGTSSRRADKERQENHKARMEQASPGLSLSDRFPTDEDSSQAV